MADYVIFGHGNRNAGTERGTFVVPKNCSIHFFERDGQLLNMAGARTLLGWLLSDHPFLQYVKDNEVVESFAAYETVPNYLFTGDAKAAEICGVPATGVYRIGQPASNGPVIPMATGRRFRISDFIGKRDNAFGNNFYWICCRAAQTNSNNTDRVTATLTTAGTTKARERVGRDSGLTPSQVVARGGKWR